MKIDLVLDEYRKGDADKRMSLFLYHRELRDAFERIEQDDPLDLREVRQASPPAKRNLFHMIRSRFRNRSCPVKSRISYDRT